MQLEFAFAQPFLEAEVKRITDEKQFFVDLFNKLPFPKLDFPISDLFQKIDWEAHADDKALAFPLTVLKGNPHQPEFSFVRQLDEAYWGYPVEYEYERPLNWRDDLIVDKI
jgi:hypothetical protein